MALESRESKNISASKSRTASQSVAVVGGSAAGLLTATVLARQGVPVRVFERIETLDHPERTLIVTHRMRALLGRAAEGSIVNEIRRFELFTDGALGDLRAEAAGSDHRTPRFDSRPRGRSATRRARDRSWAAGSIRSTRTAAGWFLKSSAATTAAAKKFTPIRLSVETARRAAWRARPDGRRSKPCRWFRRLCRCQKTWRRTPCASGSYRRTRLISIG